MFSGNIVMFHILFMLQATLESEVLCSLNTCIFLDQNRCWRDKRYPPPKSKKRGMEVLLIFSATIVQTSCLLWVCSCCWQIAILWGLLFHKLHYGRTMPKDRFHSNLAKGLFLKSKQGNILGKSMIKKRINEVSCHANNGSNTFWQGTKPSTESQIW